MLKFSMCSIAVNMQCSHKYVPNFAESCEHRLILCFYVTVSKFQTLQKVIFHVGKDLPKKFRTLQKVTFYVGKGLFHTKTNKFQISQEVAFYMSRLISSLNVQQCFITGLNFAKG